MKMKMVRFGLITMALMLLAAQSHAIDKQSLAGAWLFDEGAGNTVSDISGNSNDGELKGNPGWSEGQFGKALDFNGSSDYVEVPDSESLSTGITPIAAMIYGSE